MSLADSLRELAERLPPGGSLTLTRDGLLNLAEGRPPHLRLSGERRAL
jgi:hypothetical protein